MSDNTDTNPLMSYDPLNDAATQALKSEFEKILGLCARFKFTKSVFERDAVTTLERLAAENTAYLASLLQKGPGKVPRHTLVSATAHFNILVRETKAMREKLEQHILRQNKIQGVQTKIESVRMAIEKEAQELNQKIMSDPLPDIALDTMLEKMEALEQVLEKK